MNLVPYVLSWLYVIVRYGVIVTALFVACTIVMAQSHWFGAYIVIPAVFVWFVRFYFPSSWAKHRPRSA